MESVKPIVLSIVIVNYRTPDLVIGCLQSLIPEFELLSEASVDAQVVVVDNCSGDDSIDRLQEWHRQQADSVQCRINLLPSQINGGFSAGNNLGITARQADYYLLLNSDTIVRPGSLVMLLNSHKRSPDVGLMGPRLEFLDGFPQESCFRDQGVISEFLRGAQLSIAFKLFRQKIVAIPVEEAVTSNIDWCSFACVLIRAEVFEAIGLMDDRYFMYFEDSEFCARARKAGWRVAHESAARVVHLRGGSSSVKRRAVQKKRLPSYYYQSRSRYFLQRGGLPKLIAANSMWLFGRFLCQLKRLFGKAVDGATDREWRDIWTMPMRSRGL